MVIHHDDEVLCVRVPEGLSAGPVPPDPRGLYRSLLRDARWSDFCKRVHVALLAEGSPFERADRDWVVSRCSAFRKAGYRREAAIWNLVRAAFLCDWFKFDFPDVAHRAVAEAVPADDVAASRLILVAAQRLSDLEGGAR